MTMLSCILGGIVLVYTIAYAVVRIAPILRFNRCKNGGELQDIDGVVFEKTGEENKAYRGVMVNICMPKYEYEISGNKNYLQSTVRYRNANIGQLVGIGYCERTGEAWAIKDIPLMKRELIIRVAATIAILALLVLTEVML